MTSRRDFLAQSAMASLLISTSPSSATSSTVGNHRLKTSLNAFSFNDPLIAGKMSIEDMINYCAETNIDAVDLTGYYFKGYPSTPDSDYIFDIKRLAFKQGVGISGTGVRTDFTTSNASKRKDSVKVVKAWIQVAAKLGAPVIRVFAGAQQPANFTRTQVMDWMLEDLRECVHFASNFGVIVGLQNHDDFIKTADQALEFTSQIKSEWFGLILDTGSYRQGDAYLEIEKSAPSAVNWQIKEKLFQNGKEVPVQMDKLIDIINRSGYKGYIPIETLGAGDPKTKISTLLGSVNTSLGKL